MTDEQQPELRWAPLPAAPKRTGRVWLIAGLAAAALAIVVVFLVFVLPVGFAPEASPSPSPSASPSESPSPDQTATPTPSTTSAPTPSEPAPTAPPVPAPDADAFAVRVGPWLDDAVTGLEIAAESSGEDAAGVIEPMRQDAERLSDTPPPTSIASEWSKGVSTYLASLSDLQEAYRSGSDVSGAESAAEAALQTLRDLAGL